MRKIRIIGKMTLLLMALSAALFVPVPAARADVGPKPSLDFEFVYETDASLTITGGELLQCNDATCAGGEPLQELGPQRFSCTENACTSMAYGYSDYARLVIHFSDGVTRESQVFAIKRFHAHCRVTVREDDLVVEVHGKLFSPLASLVGGLLMVSVVVPLCLIITALWASKARKGTVTPKNARGLFVAIWVLTVLVAGGGAFISLSVPLTFLIESFIVLSYARWRTHPPASLLTGMLLANLLTQPAFLFSLLARPAWNLSWIVVAELGIWLVEAGVLHFTQRKELSFKESLVFSLFLNAVSFGLGLLLPIPTIW